MDRVDDGIREFVDEDSSELVTERRARKLVDGELERYWEEIERTPVDEVESELPDQTKREVTGDASSE